MRGMFKMPGLYDIILIDGMNLLHRAAHSYSDLGFLEGSNYIHTGAIYGSLRMVSAVWKAYADNDCQVIICWDGGYQHRIDLYPEYKAHRKRPPQDPEAQEYREVMRSQQKGIRRIIRAAGWSQAIADGFEADDVMATLSRRYGEQGHRVAIYTNDQDLHQCVTENVQVVSASSASKPDKIWNLEMVHEKWGHPPEKVAELKALAGDGGDGIPGCKGCGLGWARKILATTGTVEEALATARVGILSGTYLGKSWTARAISQRLRDDPEIIRISHELAKVVFDCPVVIDQGEPDWDKLVQVMTKLRFHSLTEGKLYRELRSVR